MQLGQPGSSRPMRPLRAGDAADLPMRATLEVLFLESTVLWASATALLGEEGRLSYSDLMVRAQNVAAVLRRKGMRPGDLVGVVGLRTFSSISGIVGILLAGGVYVPFDVHGQSTEKLTRQLDESAIRLLVTDQSDAAGASLPWARNATVVDASRLEREFMPLFRDVKLPQRMPEDPAAVVFNADGRGVLVTHGGIVRLVTAGWLMEFRSSDTVLLHAGAQEHLFQMELWGPLLAGGTVALAPQSGAGAMPAHEYARVMRRYRVSAICARQALLEELAKEPLAPLDQVQQAVVDAAEMDAPIPEGALRDRMGTRERALRVTGGLGAAETTSYAVSVRVNVEEAGHTEPVAGSEALVVLPDGHDAKPGALGALAITGDALAIGYLGQPEATLAAFADAQREGNQKLRCFRLPVLATRLPDGNLLTGQAAVAAAAAVRLSEAREGPVEKIEALLLKHPLVRECVALPAVPGEHGVCAFAALKQVGDPRAERALREYLESHLPHESQPAALILVAQIPLDTMGKPDRALLTKQCEALLRQYRQGSAAIEIRPERQVDVVRSIWQRLLHRMQVDPDEDFYASGGTAVQRIRLYAELNQRFPGAFTMAELRALNTLRKVVDHLNNDAVRERMLSAEHRGA
jgi:nonribosomal peptide synthetase DhbF